MSQIDVDPDDLRTTHETLETSGMRIASIMLGDLEAVERFLTPYIEGMLPFKHTGFLFYAIGLIMMSILLNNLLVSPTN